MRVVLPDVRLNAHAHAFDEIARALVGGLTRLGLACDVETTPADVGPQLILAPHLQHPETLAQLPRDTILYTWEPIGTAGSRVMTDAHLALLKEFVLWDYSEKNVEQWRRLGAPRVVHVPLGNDPGLLGLIGDLPEPDVDVLFYGSTNDRRVKVLKEIQDRGLIVGTLFGSFGLARDAAIARSRLILNLHFYESGILETARLAYLWANRKPVLCEVNPTTEVPFGLRDLVLSAPYEGIADAVVAALAEPARLRSQADAIAEHFATHGDAADVLRGALEATERLHAAAA